MQNANIKPIPGKVLTAKKLFVLDTNVLVHDPRSLFKFKEHDIYISIYTLEELDRNKRGMSEVARNARQASRFLDSIVKDYQGNIDDGISLDKTDGEGVRGRLFLQTESFESTIPAGMSIGKVDNHIISLVNYLQEQKSSRDTILVSKDINMRIKARALGLRAEDYHSDQVLEDSENLHCGARKAPENLLVNHGNSIESWQKDGHTFYKIQNPMCGNFLPNEFLYQKGAEKNLLLQVKEVSKNSVILSTIDNYSKPQQAVWGITARNQEQTFALNLLMDPQVHFVSLIGVAGTGKTLLALAAGLTQTMETRRFSEIIITRNTMPIGEDIGFLPGTEEEKMNPWMGAIEDNIEVLNNTDENFGKWGQAATNDLLSSRISVKSLNFMRGRTFTNKYLIIDEAQNLTPTQMKTLITRAGQGTKVICLGNNSQIDSPYLTEDSSGLTYVVDRFKEWSGSGHITLSRGERSTLADFATENL